MSITADATTLNALAMRADCGDGRLSYGKAVRCLSPLELGHYIGNEIAQVHRKWPNNWIESDQAALKRITNPGRGFQSLQTAKATLIGIEAIRMIKRGHICNPPANVIGEIRLLAELFQLAA